VTTVLIDPVSAARVERLIREFLSMPPATREKLQPFMRPNKGA
jgi:hypothetical protein